MPDPPRPAQTGPAQTESSQTESAPRVPSQPPPPEDDDTAVRGQAAVPEQPRHDTAYDPDFDRDYDPDFDRDYDPDYDLERDRDPPRIEADELAGLAPVSGPPTRSRRVMPLVDEPSHLVARYMFPTERFRGEWRRHIVHLATPLGVAAVATIGLGLGGGFLTASLGSPWLGVIVVLTWLAAMAWAGWKIAYWHYDRFLLTNKRLMVVSGIITRNVAMLPLARVTDMKYEQTPVGRMLNYGTFVIESAGQDQALREVPHLPNPNELYLRVVEEMYDPGAVEERVDKVREEEERHPGADA